ncbi:hypothetical protein lbkm_2671 [Lachnospiraceae bacterium KM106-2]|nr:hypothetical protein lbkm_2671 [Lachnospiraceae bacterium KM106-2]
MKNKHNFYKTYIITYSAMFCVLSLVIWLIFAIYGKSFVWDPDGVRQHYNTLSYLGQYLRNIFSGKGVAMMDFRIGQGFDVLTTLNYYGLGDPLNLIAVFVKQQNMEMLYGILIFIRLYLAGIAFSYYCISINKKELGPVLIGTICYVFSGFGLYTSVRHPFFINAMIYLPLLLVAAERILKKKKYGFFTWMVGLSLISNFYFAYMNTIFVGIYLLFRIFGMEKNTFLEKVKEIGKICVAYLVGVMISAVVFLPVVYAFLQNARGGDAGGYTESLLLYPKEYYQKYLLYFSAPKLMISSWTIGGYSPICLISALYLWIVHRKDDQEKEQIRIAKAIFLLLLVFTLIPLFGKIFNGFGYVCNRWCYALVMSSAMLVVYALPKLIVMTKKERVGLLAIIAVYIILMLLNTNKLEFEITLSMELIAGFTLLLFIMSRSHISERKCYVILTTVIVAGVMIGCYIIYSPGYSNYIKSFSKRGKAYEFSGRSAITRMAAVKDNSFYRVEQPWINKSNQAIIRNYNGNTFYWSLVPKTMTQYLDELGMASLDRNYACLGLDSRLILNELGATKYYVARKTNSSLVPYGYEHQKQYDYKDYRVYQNRYALSIGYGMKKYMKKSEYDKLLPIQKQEALLSCIILNDSDITTDIQNRIEEVTSKSIPLQTREIPYKIKSLDGIVMDHGRIQVIKKNASMTITYEGDGKGETYLLFHNLKLLSGINHQLISVSKKHSFYTKISLFPKNNPVYYDKEYHGIKISNIKGNNEITFTFAQKNSFQFDSLKVYRYPAKNYKKQVEDLRDHQLEQVKMGNNQVSGTVSLSSDRWMQFAIPYSIGWKAYVDGKQTSLSPSDTAYLGLLVSKGNHKVVLSYETPYIRIGAIVSFIGCLITIVSMFLVRKKEK